MAVAHLELVESAPQQGGSGAAGFEEVRAEFERNFLERGEIGAAVAAYWQGENVVDLWGGRRALGKPAAIALVAVGLLLLVVEQTLKHFRAGALTEPWSR
jgi:hypothetical protein